MVSDLTVQDFASVMLSVFMLGFCMIYVVNLALRTWDETAPALSKIFRVIGILSLTLLPAYLGYSVIYPG